MPSTNDCPQQLDEQQEEKQAGVKLQMYMGVAEHH